MPINRSNDCRVLICSENTGGGHNHAAKAVKMAIEELSQGSQSIEVLVEAMIQKTNILNHLFVALYNYLLQNHQNWIRYYIWFIEFLKPNQNSFSYELSKTYLKNMLLRVQPSIVVSVHPMVNHYLALALKDIGYSQTKLVIVVTDPNASLWSGWACSDADLIIAPNDLARDRLIELGIASDRISMIGMPIEPIFLHRAPVDKEDLLKQLGLDPKLLTVLLCGGWAGGGAIAKTYQALQAVTRPIQIIILCGHNDRLFAEMKKQTNQSVMPTAVLPYTDSLSSLMSASDLIVTKAGGLTTFEAIARRLPMAIDLLTEPMPQEVGTANMLIEANLAKPLRKVEDIVPIVESLILLENRESQPLPTEHNIDRTDAIYDIAKTILSFR